MPEKIYKQCYQCAISVHEETIVDNVCPTCHYMLNNFDINDLIAEDNEQK